MGFEIDFSAMLLDDAVADAQAQSGALADGLGGEEWIEDPIADLRIDPTPDIDTSSMRRPLRRAGSNVDAAPLSGGVDRVGEQIQDDLVDAVGEAGDLGKRLKIQSRSRSACPGRGGGSY